MEDNYLKSLTGNPTGGPDDLRGGRWVWRHNHMYDVSVQGHGTENGRWRGGRAREVYSNDFHNTTNHGVGGVRSGVTVFHDNTFDGVTPGQSGYQLQAYRSMFKWIACPFAGATGDNPWDMNDPHGLYESGTARRWRPESDYRPDKELDHKSVGGIHCEIYRRQSGCTYSEQHVEHAECLLLYRQRGRPCLASRRRIPDSQDIGSARPALSWTR